MATYNFDISVAWGSVGQFARLGVQPNTTFPLTKLDGSAASIVQGGVTKAGYIESDASGNTPPFTTTDIPSVKVNFFGQWRALHSLEAITAGAASAAAAADSASAASTSATNAATSASNASTAGAAAGTTAANAALSTKVDKTDLYDGSNIVKRAKLPLVNAPYTFRSHPLEGVPCYVYGHSYTVEPPLSGRANQSWCKKVANRFRMTPSFLGLGGAVANQVWFEANNNVSAGSPTRKWTPGSTGLVLFEATINDVVTFGSSAAAQDNYGQALRALVELWRSGTRVAADDVSITYGGTWTAGTAYLVNSGKKTSATGSTATFTFTGTAATIWVYGLSGAAPTVTVKEGATTLATVSLSTRMQTYDAPGVVGTTVALGIIPIRITGLTSGSHTLVLTSTGTGTTYFDGYSLPAAKAPQIVFVKEGVITSYSPNGSSALLTTYSSILTTVAAEYPGIVTVADPGSNWVLPTVVNTADGIGNHPNDYGHTVLADAVSDAVSNFGFISGMNIL